MSAARASGGIKGGRSPENAEKANKYKQFARDALSRAEKLKGVQEVRRRYTGYSGCLYLLGFSALTTRRSVFRGQIFQIFFSWLHFSKRAQAAYAACELPLLAAV